MNRIKRIIVAAIGRTTNAVLRQYYSPYSERWHPHHALRKIALDETTAYIKDNMSDALIRRDEFHLLTFAVDKTTLEGLFLEFGVRTGSTINWVAKLAPQQKIYGFDSFEGLPEAWTGWTQDKGHFGGEGIPRVKDNVHLVVGWFEDTLPKFLAKTSGDLAFVHIDSDLYSSAKTVLDNLAPRIKPGSIIVFNEYFNYPNWKQHEYKAFQEFCHKHAVEYEYLCWGKFEVAVRILAIERAPSEPSR